MKTLHGINFSDLFARRLCGILAITLFLVSCRDPETTPTWNNLSTSTAFQYGSKVGDLTGSVLPELSGIAPSHANPGYYWVHNDKGNQDADLLYLIDSLGTIYARLNPKGIDNRDWEDIAVGGGPSGSESYLYIGDTGDNSLENNVYFVHRIPEPVITPGATIQDIDIYTGVTLAFQYPDKKAHNSECLLLDPANHDLYVVTKGDSAGVFRLPFPQSEGVVIDAAHLYDWPIKEVTGGDISADGKSMLVRSNTKLYFWEKNSGLWPDAFTELPELVPLLSEPKGEAVGFNLWNTGFFTCSEQPLQYLYFYGRK